jgi:Ni,Fe-hydrogenase III component G
MNTETALQTAGTLLAPFVQSTATPEPGRMDVVLAADKLVPAVQTLIDKRWGYLSSLTGLDRGAQAGIIEALYIFCGTDNAAVVILRVPLARENTQVPSVCGPIPSASLYERELAEMFGITVVDTPNPARLFLPDDWPADLYPLRKDAAVPVATSLQS